MVLKFSLFLLYPRTEIKSQTSRENTNEVGQLKLSMQYRRDVLTVMVSIKQTNILFSYKII